MASSGLVAIAVPTRDWAGQLPAAKVWPGHWVPGHLRLMPTCGGSATATRRALASPGRAATMAVRVGDLLAPVPPAPPMLPDSRGANGRLAQPAGAKLEVPVSAPPGWAWLCTATTVLAGRQSVGLVRNFPCAAAPFSVSFIAVSWMSSGGELRGRLSNFDARPKLVPGPVEIPDWRKTFDPIAGRRTTPSRAGSLPCGLRL